ncbi:hypothetical protein H9L12_03050 [Sphingomonas rhizophila]|uniref:Leucine-rich repeat domain-containing protein n=1 Tax=Sphingomonas rhizophila TaxID=2071607 RepID=A0A7G9SCJ8_9SPHN|nr:hypothetical protein [Sphingomonas rhizophila]QNN65573.1 hypothetical protein H9L12_03050 [Sphingomonas rhizophila]
MDFPPTLDSALNDRFRGHVDRDWTEWRDHFHESATDVPSDAPNAWVIRKKFNYRGIGGRQALRHLIAGNVDQPFLEEIAHLVGLRRLELESPVVAKDLAPLTGLRNLTFLSIDSPRTIDDFAPILQIPTLRTLLITNAKKMSSLDWLRDAHHLEVIGIEGGMYSTYTIPSIAPLAGLRSLRAFLAVSTLLADKDLAPLAQCPRLEYLRTARFAPRQEFEALGASRPDLVCHWLRPGMWR